METPGEYENLPERLASLMGETAGVWAGKCKSPRHLRVSGLDDHDYQSGSMTATVACFARRASRV